MTTEAIETAGATEAADTSANVSADTGSESVEDIDPSSIDLGEDPLSAASEETSDEQVEEPQTEEAPAQEAPSEEPAAAKSEEPAKEEAPPRIDLAKEREERKGIRERIEAEAKARENEVALKSAQKNAEKFDEIQSLAKSSPLEALEAMGIDINEAVDAALARAEGKETAPAQSGETPEMRKLRLENEELRKQADANNEARQQAESKRQLDLAIAETARVIEKNGDRYAALKEAGVHPSKIFETFRQYVNDYKIEFNGDGAKANQYLEAIADEMNKQQIENDKAAAARHAKFSGQAPVSNESSEAITEKKPAQAVSSKMGKRSAATEEDDGLPLDPTARMRALRDVPIVAE